MKKLLDTKIMEDLLINEEDDVEAEEMYYKLWEDDRL